MTEWEGKKGAASKASTNQGRKAARAAATAAGEAYQVLVGDPPDLAGIATTQSGLWAADLTALRSAGLTRQQIDDLTLTIEPERLHQVLTVQPIAMIARLVRNLDAELVDELVTIAKDKPLPVALTDQVADLLPPLYAAGATGGRLLTVLRGLAAQFATLLAATPTSFVVLMAVGNVPKLSAMLAGGRVGQLDALASLLTPTQITRLIEAADTPANLASLGASGAGPLASLVTATPPAALQRWCRTPVLPHTVALLAHVALPTCLPVLPLLAAAAVGPTELRAALMAGVDAGARCQAIADAKALLTTPGAALIYFRTNPGSTCQDFHEAIAGPAAIKASQAPTNMGIAYTPHRTPYTMWTHNAVLDCDTLHMLLDEEYAQIRYIATFETKTEAVNGGDTEEYEIDTWDGAAYQTLWVVHLHRKKGDNKLQTPAAMHLKREKQRKLKDANRVQIDSRMAERCRKKNTS